MELNKLTKEFAESSGYRPVTDAYRNDERWMMVNAIKQLTGIKICLVSGICDGEIGWEIWRR